ncbi:target of Myb1 membrane trafficking protein isoform X1 [Misgurnus anguillicaudatus]|uniref:target of Myb1 membrane trafficking protein isoform X1 n=1 Tax=Misgurnus anguillicaudatus TaxID=75329 RepID=UPI003CCFC30A
MEFFIGNPFSTPVGQLVENATSSSLPSEDWGLNMEICDIVNETDDGAKDAVRAIKKRILGNKNFKEVMLTLSVLEACVKNCGHRFHMYVSTRDFVENVLVQTIMPKNNPPMILQDRVLRMIQAWSDAFRSSTDLTGVVTVYENLRRKGVQFPIPEANGYSPIHSPNKTATSMSPGSMPAERCAVTDLQSQNTDAPLAMSPEQIQRLQTDLEVVHKNLSIMSDLMSKKEPGRIQRSDTEQLQQLYMKSKEMQGHMVELIPRLTDEKLTEQLLTANDNINATFTQYYRFERHLQQQSNTQTETQHQLKAQGAVAQSTVSTLSNQMAGLSTKTEDFTQNRNGSLQKSPQNIVAVDGLAANPRKQEDTGTDDSLDSTTFSSSPQFQWMIAKGMIPVDQNDIMDDIEQWLNVDVDDSDGVTSEEFDKFLAQRAKAAERLPSVTASIYDPDISQP